MNWIKIFLAALGLVFLAMILFWIVGIISAILWFVIWAGLIGVIGYGAYKFLSKTEEKPKLAEKTPIAIAEIKSVDRQLEEYKRKYLPK
ncbi:MAG: hypothetical protein ABWZ66_03675 [Pyrinomonadaceae bacterium]